MAQSIAGKTSTVAGSVYRGARVARRRRAHWGVWVYLLLVAGLLALGAVGGVVAFEYSYAGRIYPGVEVAGIPVGGLSVSEAERAVVDELSPYPGKPVLLRYGERTWSFTPDDLGVTVDGRATVAQAYEVGRSGALALLKNPGNETDLRTQWESLKADLLQQWRALVDHHSLPIQLQYDDNKVTFALMRIARDIDLAPREGSLTVSGLQVIASDGKPGRQVDIEASRATLMRVAHANQGGMVFLVVQERQPVVTSVQNAAERVTALLSQPLTLSVRTNEATQRLAIDRATLRQWLDIRPVPRTDGSVSLNVQLDSEQVTAYLKQLAGTIDRPAQDAAVDFDPTTRQIKVLKPSQAGQQLDVAAGVAAIEAAVLAENRQAEIAIPVKLVQPKIDSSKTNELGIVELVAEGSTTFAGSSAERVHNIVNAADKFKHVVVAPNQDFSFNKHVGEITAANGFADGLIIAGDRTAVGIGGGVCQVSTTAFRAALNGGFPITERHAHGYVVSWYGKPGMDATIYTPDVDFRFRNDTGHYLVVKSSVDTAKGTITFSIYGTKPQRTVEIEPSVVTNVKPPEKALYQEDKSLAAGVIKQVDWAANGQDALVVRRVKNSDGTVQEDKFVSHYQPWRAIYLYGPGTNLPAGAKE